MVLYQEYTLFASLIGSVCCIPVSTDGGIEYELVCNKTLSEVTHEDCQNCPPDGCLTEILQKGCWKNTDHWYKPCYAHGPCALHRWRLNNGTYENQECRLRCSSLYDTCNTQLKQVPTPQPNLDSTSGLLEAVGLPHGAIAGLTIAGLIVFAIGAFLICRFWRKLKHCCLESKPFQYLKKEKPTGPVGDADNDQRSAQQGTISNGDAHRDQPQIREQSTEDGDRDSGSEELSVTIGDHERVVLIKKPKRKTTGPGNNPLSQYSDQPGTSSRPDMLNPQTGDSMNQIDRTKNTSFGEHSRGTTNSNPQSSERMKKRKEKPKKVSDSDDRVDDDNKTGKSPVRSDVESDLTDIEGRQKPSEPVDLNEEANLQKTAKKFAEHHIADTEDTADTRGRGASEDESSDDSDSGRSEHISNGDQ